MAQVNFHPSMHSLAESTKSGISNASAVEELRKSRKSFFSDRRKSRKSIGAYTSLFTRKLIPPLGFYREADKYHQMQKKFINEPEKLEALEEMWNDYQKYQIRKRFRWPPNLICKKFFWTTGYYADYQKESRATRLRKPGEDSSDDEFMDPAGQFEIAGTGDDINVEEFGRYRQAKKLNQDANKDPNRKRMTRFFENDDDEDDGQDQGDQRDPKQGKGRKSKGKGKGKALKGDDADELGERRPTLTRLFDDNDNDKGSNKGSDKKARKSKLLMKDGVDSLEETETTVQVEYTLIKDPNKKKKKSKSKRKTKEDDRSSVASSSNKPSEPVKIPGLTAAESEKLAKTYDQALAASSADPAANAKPNLFVRRTSIATSYVDPETGQKMVDVQEVGGNNITVGEDEYVPAKHSLTTLSTIWDTKDDNLKKQYSTHTLTVTNLPDKANISAMAKLFPGAKVNLKTPKKPGDLPYATVRFKDAEVCKKIFLDAANMMLDGKKLEVKPKVVKR